MSSTTRDTSSGGVRNLRAMFENKGGDIEASPPSRGRSPAASDASAHSRPISKVRASFVAVERPGDLGPSGQQWGLRKASDVSSMAEVKEEALRDEEEGDANNHPSGDKAATEAIEEIPGINGSSSKPSQNTSKTEMNGTLGKASKGSAPAKKDEKLSEAGTKTPNSASKSNDAPKAKPTSVKSTGAKPTKATERAKEVDHKKQEAARPAKTNTPKDSTATELKRKPSKISTTSKPSTGSPTMPRTPKTPSSAGTVKPAVKGSPNKPAAVTKSAAQAQAAGAKQNTTPQKSGRASLATSTTASKRESTTSAQKPSHEPNHAGKAEHLKPGETITTGGFVKPRPKSPTRPVRLPAAAMSSTASSSAKTGSTTEGSSLGRKPSTLKRDRAPPPTTANRSLDKKSSRASLSHFDSHKAHANEKEKERSRSRMSTSTAGKAPDDGFLARMMRPTASSSQKVHDKVESQPSPPRQRAVSGSSKTDTKPHHHEPHHHEPHPREPHRHEAPHPEPHHHEPHHHDESRRVSTAPKKTSEHKATSHPKKEEPKKDIQATKLGKTTKEDNKEDAKVDTPDPAPSIEAKPESKSEVTHDPEDKAKEKEELVQATPALIAEPKAADVIPVTSKDDQVEHEASHSPATPAKPEPTREPQHGTEAKPTDPVPFPAPAPQPEPETKTEDSLPETSHVAEPEKVEAPDTTNAAEPTQPVEEEQEEEPEQDTPTKEPSEPITDSKDIAIPSLHETVADTGNPVTGDGVEELKEEEETRNEEVEKWKEEQDEKIEHAEVEAEHHEDDHQATVGVGKEHEEEEEEEL